mgnify:FL=1
MNKRNMSLNASTREEGRLTDTQGEGTMSAPSQEDTDMQWIADVNPEQPIVDDENYEERQADEFDNEILLWKFEKLQELMKELPMDEIVDGGFTIRQWHGWELIESEGYASIHRVETDAPHDIAWSATFMGDKVYLNGIYENEFFHLNPYILL